MERSYLDEYSASLISINPGTTLKIYKSVEKLLA
jgi:hypothetical protein